MTALPRCNATSLPPSMTKVRTAAQSIRTLLKRIGFLISTSAVALVGFSSAAVEPVPTGDAVAQEFRNVQYNYYFLTNSAAEKAFLLAQNTSSKTVWESTGQYVRLYAKATDNSGAKGLRRFEFKGAITSAPYSSHVYLVSQTEIALVNAQMLANATKIVDEGNTGFVLESDSGTGGQQPSCIKGQTPVWRAFNASRFHHRYTNDFGFYADTILANLPGDTGWAKDNEEIKFCAVESAAHYSLKVETNAVGTGNTMAVKVTVTDADAAVLVGGSPTTQQVRVNLQLPPELSYVSDDLLTTAKCSVQSNKAGTTLSCSPSVVSGGQATFNLSLTAAATYAPTTQKIQAIAAAATSETHVDPRQCSEAARPSFGCTVGIAAVINTTSKSVSFSPAVASTSAGASAATGLTITRADQKLTTVSVFAPSNVGVFAAFGQCGAGEVTGSGTKYTCAFTNPTLAISVTANTAGSYVLWSLIPGAAVSGADACVANPTPSGCARLDLTATAPNSPVALAFSAVAPPAGTVNSSYSWQYACVNQSINQVAIGVTCSQSDLPDGLSSSCNDNQTRDLSPNGVVPCQVSGTPKNAATTFFNLTASASNASPQRITQNASVTINGQAIVVPPISAAPKISDPTLTLVAGTATQGSLNTATVNYSFTSNVAQTVYLVLLEEVGGVTNPAVMTGVLPSQQFALSAGVVATGTISFSTSQSPASVRLCVLPSAPVFSVRCDNAGTSVVSASALSVNFAAPPPPAATATVVFSTQPTATVVGATAAYAVTVTQTGTAVVTLPLTVAITVPNLFSVMSAPGCTAATGNSQVLNCAITALPQTITINVQPQPGASAVGRQLFALAISSSTGASAPFTCVGASPASACASSNVLTPTFYDMAAQTYTLPSGNQSSALECKNVGTRATESGNLTCTVELTYEDSTTKAVTSVTYQTITSTVLAAGASLPIMQLYAADAKSAITTCGSVSTPSTTTCDVLAAPPTGSTLKQVKLTAAAGGGFDGVTTANDSKTVTAGPIIVPPVGISCTDQATDQQYSFDGNYDSNGAFSPRTFRAAGQSTASFEIIPGAYTVTAGYPARYNRLGWQWVGPQLPLNYKMTISPCRGDFTSADALRLSLPGYTPPDNVVGINDSLSLFFDEPARVTAGTVYSMAMSSNRRWYVNVMNDTCPSGDPCALNMTFKHALR